MSDFAWNPGPYNFIILNLTAMSNKALSFCTWTGLQTVLELMVGTETWLRFPFLLMRTLRSLFPKVKNFRQDCDVVFSLGAFSIPPGEPYVVWKARKYPVQEKKQNESNYQKLAVSFSSMRCTFNSNLGFNQSI